MLNGKEEKNEIHHPFKDGHYGLKSVLLNIAVIIAVFRDQHIYHHLNIHGKVFKPHRAEPDYP